MGLTVCELHCSTAPGRAVSLSTAHETDTEKSRVDIPRTSQQFEASTPLLWPRFTEVRRSTVAHYSSADTRDGHWMGLGTSEALPFDFCAFSRAAVQPVTSTQQHKCVLGDMTPEPVHFLS